jgi:hypothetical protein
MIAAAPPIPVCSSVSFGASGLVCASAPVEKPFSCPAGKIVTLTVNDKLVCVALHPVRLSAIAGRTAGGR